MAEKLAQEFKATKTYNSYKALVADTDIEAVYIGTLHLMHKESVLMCLNAGKPVICEKPFMMNAGETEGVIQAGRNHGGIETDRRACDRLDHLSTAFDAD